jgi:hypothetical protein
MSNMSGEEMNLKYVFGRNGLGFLHAVLCTCASTCICRSSQRKLSPSCYFFIWNNAGNTSGKSCEKVIK